MHAAAAPPRAARCGPQHKAAARAHQAAAQAVPRRVRCRLAPHQEAPAADELRAAWALLKAFTAAQIRGQTQQYVGSAASRAKLRDALLLAYAHPWAEEGWAPDSEPEVLLGLVASEARLALRGLRDWTGALQLGFVQPACRVAGAASLAAVKGSVYVKYNARSQVCYMSDYKGRDRGVLVQLGTGPLLGHFPLGFFDEAMANPEPSLEQPSSRQPSAATTAAAAAAAAVTAAAGEAAQQQVRQQTDSPPSE